MIPKDVTGPVAAFVPKVKMFFLPSLSFHLGNMCFLINVFLFYLIAFVLLAGPNGRSAQVLLAMTIPGHLVFIYTIYLIQGSQTLPTPVFISLYLVAAFTQVL